MTRTPATVVAALAVVLAGCAGAPPTPVDSAAPATADVPVTGAAQPGPGPGPGPSGNGDSGLSLDLPGAPVGRVGETLDANGSTSCVTLNYLGNTAIPDGVTLVVDRVILRNNTDGDTGKSYFTVLGSGCDGRACVGVRWTQAGTSACSVAVRAATGPGSPTADASVELTLGVAVRCPAGQKAACQQFVDAASGEGKSVSLDFVASATGGSATATATATS